MKLAAASCTFSSVHHHLHRLHADDAAFASAFARVDSTASRAKGRATTVTTVPLTSLYSAPLSSIPRSSSRSQARCFGVADIAPSKSLSRLSAAPSSSDEGRDDSWANRALLFSSMTDGVSPNPFARAFLRHSLVGRLLGDRVVDTERDLEDSAKCSPCCGPTDVGALGELEGLDLQVERGRGVERILAGAMGAINAEVGSDDDNDVDGAISSSASWAEEALACIESEHEGGVPLRILYVPTAMYALNPTSSNTPGKQRQRARSDGKKRRTKLIQLVEELLSGGDANLNVLAVTLDLDDGSVKQPEGSEDASLFPKNGVGALTSWNPHLVYLEGGNTFWLQHCIEKGSWTELLSGAAAAAVYCGKSAGAIVAGKTMSTATWKGWDDPSVVPGKETYEDWMPNDSPGLGLAGTASFFPHMNDDWSDVVKERTLSLDEQVFCLREEDACCIFGDRKEFYTVSAPIVEEIEA